MATIPFPIVVPPHFTLSRRFESNSTFFTFIKKAIKLRIPCLSRGPPASPLLRYCPAQDFCLPQGN
jgi:hypothetical protein